MVRLWVPGESIFLNQKLRSIQSDKYYEEQKYLKSRKIQYISQSKYFLESVDKDDYCTKHLKVKFTKKSSFTAVFC